MIDHLLGSPNPSFRRTQVFLVIVFWVWRVVRGDPAGPIPWLRRANRYLEKRLSPWQLVVSTLTGVYAIRNFDKILGLPAPEPLAGVYSPSFYRATWITTGLDAGFATAMSIRPKWLRDICSIVFSAYYIIYAHEADEKLRKFRAVPSVDMLRTTWEKTTNPYIRAFTYLPDISMRRKVLLPRPKTSRYQRPITGYLFFSGNERQLGRCTDLVLDFPGGGFISMNPEHHEERLRIWATRTGIPVLSIDYGKAPEYPYPFGIDEAFDTYRVLVDSLGSVLGMSARKLNIIITGDSAGATMAINAVLKTLEHNDAIHSTKSHVLPLPIAIILNYAFLDFNFTSWMSIAQKDHLHHLNSLSVVGPGSHRNKMLKRRTSWRDALRGFASGTDKDEEDLPPLKKRHSTSTIKIARNPTVGRQERSATISGKVDDVGSLADAESEDDVKTPTDTDHPSRSRVRFASPDTFSPSPSASKKRRTLGRSESVLEKRQHELSAAVLEADTKALKSVSGREGSNRKDGEPLETRLTMTSRTAYFQDRIVSPSMMRAMATLYIGPHRNPDFAKDYHLSPILAPDRLLAQLPPMLLQCGEKDPFVDDTIIFVGRVKNAKRARQAELDQMLSSIGAKHGESLRMSSENGPHSALETRLPAMRKERDKLAGEVEDDWAKMTLFSDWSHGYLQMPTLMEEALSVIEDLADYISDTFERSAVDVQREGRSTSTVPATLGKPSASETETDRDDGGITFVPKKLQIRGQDSEYSRPVDELQLENGVSYASDASAAGNAVVPGTKSGAARQTGQTITETELMRRRRLIDSHIFE